MSTNHPHIHFDEADDAAELVKALQTEGYVTRLVREAFAGEDDAEDHAWALVVEPFDDRVVEMVDVYGGWLPQDVRLDSGPAVEPPGGRPPAGGLPLPDAPRRIKGS